MSAPKTGESRYDYRNQCWVRFLFDGLWTVERCGHVAKVKGCYACNHAGENIGHHGEIR